MNIVEFLESLRQPVLTFTGLPSGAVYILAYQSVEELVLAAVAQHQCAVLMDITGFTGSADWQTMLPAVTAMLEVEVWTPEVISTEGGVRALTIAEHIMAGLHGYKGPDREEATSSTRVPAFRRGMVRGERKENDRFLVINLQFEVQLVPVPLPQD